MKKLDSIIYDLKCQVETCKNEGGWYGTSWGMQEGVLISGEDAQFIVDLLNAKPRPTSSEEIEEIIRKHQ